MKKRVHDLCQNRLLAALPAEERERLSPDLELVPMEVGQSLYNSSSEIRHVYFPTTAIVSLLYEMDDGAVDEIAVVASEGIVGIALFMGGETTLSRAVVQSAGYGYQMKGQVLKREFHRAGPMQRLLLRYTQALMTEVAQTLVCNRHHSLDQQFCRWLLLRFDRLPSNKLAMSQERIANLLGVRRGSISEIEGKLRKDGLISYHRGHLALIDRVGLQARGCECYAVIKEEFDRLLPKPIAT